MTTILGLSCFYHDSAAALVRDGDIVAAAQEERFTRKKHDDGFPEQAVDYCLRASGLTIKEVDYVIYYEKPLVKFERLIETYLAYAPRGFASFRLAIPTWAKEKLFLRSTLSRRLGIPRRTPLLFASHHESHAASAFYPSPFAEAAILTVDGVGEWTTTAIAKGTGGSISLLKEIRFPHSLGLLYSAFTHFCGFKVNSGEYKLMGLAPYGKPVFRDLIMRELIELAHDGGFRLNLDYFDYPHGLRMTSSRFHRLFGRSPREPESPLETIHLDLAASIQAVTEEAMLRLARHARELTGCPHLVMAGGVALNCVANGVIDRSGIFERVWVQPAAGDAGGALGAALFAWHRLLGNARAPSPNDTMNGSLLGPAFTDDSIRKLLDERGVGYQAFEEDASLVDQAARALSQGQSLGWFQGRMEFGPRALGSRSILADPRDPTTQSKLNLRIKYRESFRPFAPIVLAERAEEWFDMRPGQESPYMLHVAGVRPERMRQLDPKEKDLMESDPDLRKRVAVPRSSIPAVTHIDGSARIQTVDAQRNPLLHQLLNAFFQITGVPILVNTSFNVRGEPIVCTPDDALRCFAATEIDILVLGRHWIRRADLPQSLIQEKAAGHLSRFALD